MHILGTIRSLQSFWDSLVPLGVQLQPPRTPSSSPSPSPSPSSVLTPSSPSSSAVVAAVPPHRTHVVPCCVTTQEDSVRLAFLTPVGAPPVSSWYSFAQPYGGHTTASATAGDSNSPLDPSSQQQDAPSGGHSGASGGSSGTITGKSGEDDRWMQLLLASSTGIAGRVQAFL